MALTLPHALRAGGEAASAGHMFQTSLAPDCHAPHLGRAAIAEACSQWGVPHLSATAELVTSELLSNAVLHARTPLVLMAEESDGQVIIAVSDGDPTLPRERVPDSDDEHGRGLQIVDALCATWGIQRTILGKTIWVLIDGSRPTR